MGKVKKRPPGVVRRPDRAEGGITPEEKVKLDEHAKLWIKRILRTEPIDPDKIGEAIRGLYRVSGLREPRVIVVPSPLAMAVAGGFASAILARRSATRSATYIATDSATDSATDIATRSATRSATYSATYIATRSATDSATYSATDSATRSATRSATELPDGWAIELAQAFEQVTGVATSTMLAEARNWYSYAQGGNFWAQYDSCLTAARDVLGLRLPEHEKYQWWEMAAIEGCYRFMHPDFCLVSDFPVHIKRDEENRPHSADGPSVLWRDGWAFYHWHGIEVPSHWIVGPKPSAREILAETNAEKRRAGMEILGWAAALAELGARTIDADPDPQIGTLVEVDLPDAPGSRFVKVRCATGRDFALPVPREMRTALEANAWTYNIPPDALRVMQCRT